MERPCEAAQKFSCTRTRTHTRTQDIDERSALIAASFPPHRRCHPRRPSLELRCPALPCVATVAHLVQLEVRVICAVLVGEEALFAQILCDERIAAEGDTDSVAGMGGRNGCESIVPVGPARPHVHVAQLRVRRRTLQHLQQLQAQRSTRSSKNTQQG